MTTNRTIMAWIDESTSGCLIHRHYMPRIFVSYWRQQLRSLSVSRLFICLILSSFFLSCPLLQRSCSPGSHPQQATTTPTSCTPWRTRDRPSLTIISLPSRCKSSLGLTWPVACHHGNSPSLSLTQLELEVRPSTSWPSLNCHNRQGRGYGWEGL